MPQTPERSASIARLEARANELRAEIFATLRPWQRVQVARHPNRPCTLDYVERLFTEFTELHGDRRFADDKAIVTGLRRSSTASRWWSSAIRRAATPSRRSTGTSATRSPRAIARRCASCELAEKFQRPVIVFIDTPAAYPGVESEERGVAEAIALNLREMALLERADRRRRLRRRRQRRRARHRGRRSRADAGVRRLQRDSAGRLRRDPLARREAEGRGGRGAEDHGAGSAGARASSTRSSRSRSAARTWTTTGPRRWSTRRSRVISASCSAMTPAERLDARYDEVPGDGRGSGRRSSTTAPPGAASRRRAD